MLLSIYIIRLIINSSLLYKIKKPNSYDNYFAFKLLKHCTWAFSDMDNITKVKLNRFT